MKLIAYFVLFISSLLAIPGIAHAEVVRKEFPLLSAERREALFGDGQLEKAVPRQLPSLRGEGPPSSPEAVLRSVIAGRNNPTPPPDYGPPTEISGKLLGVDYSGRYTCSGTVLNTANRNLVLTAGHCVWFFGWANAITFVPGYRDGQRPYGTFEVREAIVPTAWTRLNSKFDVAVLEVRRNWSGQSVADVVGGARLQYNRSRFGEYIAYGYPGGANRGRFLRSCESRSWAGPFRTDIFSRRGPTRLSISCQMARGSSGGGWFRYEPAWDTYFLNGITSTGNNFAGRLNSPYFGLAVRRLVGSMQ